MLSREFDRLVQECFAPVLEPHGFSSVQSNHSTFWRRVDSDIYHFIMADRFHHRPAYDIMVFASSPLIDPGFAAGFPDRLGVPADTFCRLNAKQGIANRGSEFPCGTKEAFRMSFRKGVSAALANVAVPYLDSLCSMERLLATVRHPAFKLSESDQA